MSDFEWDYKKTVDFSRIYVTMGGRKYPVTPSTIRLIAPHGKGGSRIEASIKGRKAEYKVEETPEQVRAMAEGTPSEAMKERSVYLYEAARKSEFKDERKALGLKAQLPSVPADARYLEQSIGALEGKIREIDNAIGKLDISASAEQQLLETSRRLRRMFADAEGKRRNLLAAREDTTRKIAAIEQLRNDSQPDKIREYAEARTRADIEEANTFRAGQPAAPIFKETVIAPGFLQWAFGHKTEELGYTLDKEAMQERERQRQEQAQREQQRERERAEENLRNTFGAARDDTRTAEEPVLDADATQRAERGNGWTRAHNQEHPAPGPHRSRGRSR